MVYIYCIFLSKLFFVINDIYICGTHVFKVVLSLTLLNYLGVLKSRKKKIYISKKIFFQKNILIFTPKFENLYFSSRGPRRWPKWPRPTAGPGGQESNSYKYTQIGPPTSPLVGK